MERFILVTDIHLGVNRGNKKGTHAPRLLKRVHRIAEKERVDYIAENGDRIIYTNPDSDRASLEQLTPLFNQFSMPVHSINGNHDIGNLSVEDNARILGKPMVSFSYDIKGSHNIHFSPRLDIEFNRSLDFAKDDLDWLARDLNANKQGSDLPVKVFVHIPADNLAKDDEALAKTQKFIPAFATNARDFRKILEDDGRTEFVFSGHRHTNRIRKIWQDTLNPRGIVYITHQSLVQRNPNTGHPRGAFTLYEVEDKRMVAHGYGVGQPSFSILRRTR